MAARHSCTHALRPGMAATFAAGAVLAASIANAQVNVEVLRRDPLRSGPSVSLESALALNRGNVELVDVSGAAMLEYQSLHPPQAPGSAAPRFVAQRVYATENFRFVERAGATALNQGFVHGRWTGMWHRNVGSEVFLQYQFNQFQRLRLRTLAGAGVRTEIVRTSVLQVAIASAYMLEYEAIDVAPGASDPPERLDHRWTSMLSLRVSLFDRRLTLQNSVYVQPRFDEFGDFRLLESFEAAASVTGAFSIGFSLGVLYDSRPPTTVQNTDLRMSNTVRVTF